MKMSKRQSFDNFEDFLNKVLLESYAEDRFAERLGGMIGDRVVEAIVSGNSKKGGAER